MATIKSDTFCRVPYGVLAFLWRKLLGFVNEHYLNNDHIVSLKVDLQNQTTLLMNVCCPCDYSIQDSLLNYEIHMTDFGVLSCHQNRGTFYVEFLNCLWI